ncbi:C6 transcription factor [Fusarium denticulatum]|uniref:C6 transcription factor n=1 Tax=Fusarium denticulatum TaxID=48507 RepID=A0A8H5X9L8_9HYPO|nr:C6 transcription factor [Fusarium denticulatum]
MRRRPAGAVDQTASPTITVYEDWAGSQVSVQNASEPGNLGPTALEPPRQVLDFLVDVYRTRLHFQPFPLLHLEGLTEQLLAGPPFALWSFMALILTVDTHGFYKGTDPTPGDVFACSAEDAVMKLAFEGATEPIVIQSLCLIALKHMRTYQPARACMAIGAASRLLAIRKLFNIGCSSVSGDRGISCAYWSVFLFEKLFFPHVLGLSDVDAPPYPGTEVLPPPSPPLTEPRRPSPQVSSRDVSITSSCIRLISTWGRLSTYLHRLRQADIEKPWLPESTHAKLSLELLEFESQYSKRHLLKNVGFSTRTEQEISGQREYWNPWMITQIIWHAAQAILNHPFLHLIVLRSQDEIPQSCLFLQQRVEMAMYHAGWLFRIIRMSNGAMEIVDPMIGAAVAATATVQWLFQFSKETKVARRAQQDLVWCDALLSKMATMWPHLAHSLVILKRLQTLADQNRREAANQETTIRFHSEWFWELLDTGIWQSSSSDVSLPYTSVTTQDDCDTRMSLKSHFIDPFQEEQDVVQEQQTHDSGLSTVGSLFMGSEGLEHFHIDELSLDFPGWNFEI